MRAPFLLALCVLLPAISRGASAADLELRVSTDLLPSDALQRKCTEIAKFGKRRGVPPYCDGSPTAWFVKWTLTQKEPGCQVTLHPGFSPASVTFVQNLGNGWRRWTADTFALHGKNCEGLHAFVRVLDSSLATAWHYLGSPQPAVTYLVTLSRASDESMFERGYAGPPPFNLPAAMGPHLGEIAVCRDGSPLNGCAPGSPVPSVSPAQSGVVTDAQALLNFSVTPLAEKQFEGKGCRYFTCPVEDSNPPQYYAAESAVCHDGEWYFCDAGAWRYRGFCSDRGRATVQENFSGRLEQCRPAGQQQARSEAEDAFASALARDPEVLRQEAEATRLRAEQALQGHKPNPLIQGAAVALENRLADRQAQLFGSLADRVTGANSGSALCTGVYNDAVSKAGATTFSESCAENRKTLEYLQSLTNQVVLACGSTSTQGRAFLDEMKIARERQQSAVQHQLCR